MISMRCGTRPVGGSIRLASTFFSRFAGLMFRKSLAQGSGLLLMPCSGIHMCFMRMPLDVIYLDASFRVLGTQRGLKPWRLGKAVPGAKLVLELPVGAIDRCGIAEGAILAVEAPEAASAEEIRGIHEYQGTGNCVES